eukprot:9192694-Heterocapsa_arctica.AAC.1
MAQGVDEFTTRKLYYFLSQKQPTQAGALRNYHRWSLVSAKSGLQHIWWECPAMNSVSNLGRTHQIN